MKLKPILFSTPMVKALLDGRKTQTRRVATKLPSGMYDVECDYDDATDKCIWYATCGSISNGCAIDWRMPLKPKYQPRDILWVRETTYLWGTWVKNGITKTGKQKYKFVWDKTKPAIYAADGAPDYICKGWQEVGYFKRPSIHMPREAARIFLRVKDGRIERVQDISEEDAIAEGVERLFDHLTKEKYMDWANRVGEHETQEEQPYKNYLWHGHFGDCGTGNKQSDEWSHQYSSYENARGSFSSLWHLINAKRGYGWDKNPWIWVYTFERISKEEAIAA